MSRFQYQKKSHRASGMILFLCVFIVTITLFLRGITGLSEDTVARQKQALENAITRSMTYCYAAEGRYPENLDYLKEHYGLIYDEELFYVDYRTTGSNLLPDITIIEKGESR